MLTLLAMTGGFTLACISIGWSDGTYSYIIDTFTRNRLGHIQIHKTGYLERSSIYKTIENYEALGEKISEIKGVEFWTPRIFSAGLASVGEKTAGIKIIGIDPVRETASTRFDKKIIEGSMFSGSASNKAMIGEGLSRTLDASLGDKIVVVSQAADGSIANDLYTISAIVKTGDPGSDKMAFYLPLQSAQELLALQGRVHEIAIIADDTDHVLSIVKKIKKKLHDPQLEVLPWQKFAVSFYRAMKADQSGMWISLFVIIIVVATGVLNTVLMSVLERTREYGVLKALGSRPGQIFQLVLCEVNIMAVGSIVLGSGLGLLANHFLSIHGISLPEALSYGGIKFKTMYAEINLRSLTIPALTILVSASLIAIFPAIRAAKTEPARAMRTH